MSTADVSKKVLQYKLQLSESRESKTVLKILKKLQEFDITLDILAETGIGKAVNALRKHGEAGEVAKSLVSNWKKLVPKESSSHTVEGPASQSECLKTGVEKQKHSEEYLKTEDQSHNAWKTDENADVSKREPWNSEDKHQDTTELEQLQDAEKKEPRKLKKGHFKCKKENKNALKTEHLKCQVEKREEKRDNNGLMVSEKTNYCNNENVQREGKRSKSSHEKSRSCKESKNNLDPGGKCGTKRDSNRKCLESSSKLGVEVPSKSEVVSKMTVFDIANDQGDKESAKVSNNSLMCDGKKGQRKQVSERKRVCCTDKEKTTDEGQAKKIKEKRAKIMNEDRQTEIGLVVPSMSFESYLSYDVEVPKRKKSGDNKRPSKKCKTFENGERPHTTKSIKELHKVAEDFHPSKTGSVMDLLNIPLPKYLPECDEPSSFHYFERKTEEKVSEVSDLSEGTPIFTGQRLNKKMQVYSGAKTTFLPAMMTLYQQCIRALQNNIDLLYEIGGVPFEIIEPVLKRCIPDQLLLIEESNPVYIGLTDHLWEKHCRKDFRGHQLEEYESWREMHLRLSKERERKLKRLTKSIVSAHSGKPKGRQMKLVFIHSAAKPPRNVQIQQEIHGTTGAIVQPNLLDRPSVKLQDNRARPSHIAPAKPSTATSGTSQAQDPCKKGRMAPMMAKTLKAFKKHLGHR